MQYATLRMVPPLSALGFRKARIPPRIFKRIKDNIQSAIDNIRYLRTEAYLDSIFSPPSFEPLLYTLAFEKEILQQMKGLHESFARGTKLQPTSVYGVRFYRNGSSMAMHVEPVSCYKTTLLTI
jgi:hypothetical protein